MKTYLVTWQIDIEADNPREAAAKALVIQRDNDPANLAVVFGVMDYDTYVATTVDLSKGAGR